MKAEALKDRAEIIHLEILRRKRVEREQAAAAATISVENRNLSLEWSRKP